VQQWHDCLEESELTQLRLLVVQCQLVTTKQAQQQASAAGLNAAKVGASEGQQQTPTQRQSSSSGQAPGPAAQELRLHVPIIGARLDSRQFEVLMDVIQNIAMAPLPQVRGSQTLLGQPELQAEQSSAAPCGALLAGQGGDLSKGCDSNSQLSQTTMRRPALAGHALSLLM
jgi:hypothetical protein